MIEAVVIPLLAIHLVAVNVGSAGPLAAAWLLQRSSEADAPRRRLAQRVARGTFLSLLIGLALGGALLLLPLPGMQAALQRLPERTYIFAAAELLFSVACGIGLIYAARSERPRPALAWLLALLSSSNLLYHFPPLMIVMGELAVDPRWSGHELIDHAAMLRLWMRPEVASLWAHFVLASLAAGPIAALWLQRDEAGNGNVGMAPTSRRLASWALAATVLQLPVGVWVAVAAEASTREALMGGSVAASASFIVGVFAALGLMQALAHVAMGETQASARRKCAWMFALVALLMTATLRTSRTANDNAAALRAPPHVLEAN
jgi:hypothetical protein